MLKPGHILEISSHDQATENAYWSVEDAVLNGQTHAWSGDDQSAIDALEDLLRDAVERRDRGRRLLVLRPVEVLRVEDVDKAQEDARELDDAKEEGGVVAEERHEAQQRELVALRATPCRAALAAPSNRTRSRIFIMFLCRLVHSTERVIIRSLFFASPVQKVHQCIFPCMLYV